METLTDAVLAALGSLAATTVAVVCELQGVGQTRAAEAPPAATTVVSRDGTRIAFERSGAGPVLVLVSGALSNGSDQARLAALLAGRFTVIHYDRRGRGGSGDTAPYAIAREVEDIEALIDAAGGTAFVFGSSSGAVLALEAASRLPAKVAKVAMYEPPFIVDASRPPVPAEFVSHVGELVAAGRRGDAVEYFMQSGVGLPAELVAGMRALPMWAGLERLAHTLVYDSTLMDGTQAGRPLPRDRWATAAAPALVMVGGASPPWLLAAGDALVELLPRAQHVALEGCDHSVVTSAPQALAPELVRFFLE